jgi:uncharacterized surface protein with fasciclin (FAS1) repeats
MTFSTQTINRLHKELIESFLRIRSDNSVSITWLEHAYIANSEAMGPCQETPETNLNTLLEQMASIPSSLNDTVRDAFEAMLTYAICFDRINDGLHLDAAWAYLCNGNEQRIESLQAAFAILTRKNIPLNEKKRDVPQRLILAALLDEDEFAAPKQISRLINLILANPDNPKIAKALNQTHLAFPQMSAKIGAAYTQEFLDSGLAVERPIDENLKRLNVIFPNNPSLHTHATSLLHELFTRTISGLHPETILSEIDSAFDLLALSGNSDYEKTLEKVISTNFNHFIDMFRRIFDSNVMIERLNRLSYFTDKLDNINIDWRQLLCSAINCRDGKFYSDPIIAAGESLLRSNSQSYRFLLCATLILTASSQDIIERFHERQDILLAIHSVTNDIALVSKMNQATKRKAITSDLGL